MAFAASSVLLLPMNLLLPYTRSEGGLGAHLWRGSPPLVSASCEIAGPAAPALLQPTGGAR